MNIANWKPVISCRSFGGESLIDVSMKFKANIICPCCKKPDKMETSGHLLGGIASFPENIEWELDDVVESRECDFCGIVFSPVPAAVRASFSKEVFAKVTCQWRDSEIKKLEAQAKRKWQNFANA